MLHSLALGRPNLLNEIKNSSHIPPRTGGEGKKWMWTTEGSHEAWGRMGELWRIFPLSASTVMEKQRATRKTALTRAPSTSALAHPNVFLLQDLGAILTACHAPWRALYYTYVPIYKSEHIERLLSAFLSSPTLVEFNKTYRIYYIKRAEKVIKINFGKRQGWNSDWLKAYELHSLDKQIVEKIN